MKEILRKFPNKKWGVDAIILKDSNPTRYSAGK